MKNIIIGLILVVSTLTVSAQFDKLHQVAQEMNAKHKFTVDFVVDQKLNFSKSDIDSLIIYVNSTYAQGRVNFNFGELSYKPLNKLSLKGLYNTGDADLTIFIIGDNGKDVIGLSHVGAISTSNATVIVNLGIQESLKDCSGIVMHEIGHLFGLKHGNDGRYIMSEDSNSTYCGLISKGNKLMLINYKKKNIVGNVM